MALGLTGLRLGSDWGWAGLQFIDDMHIHELTRPDFRIRQAGVHTPTGLGP